MCKLHSDFAGNPKHQFIFVRRKLLVV